MTVSETVVVGVSTVAVTPPAGSVVVSEVVVVCDVVRARVVGSSGPSGPGCSSLVVLERRVAHDRRAAELFLALLGQAGPAGRDGRELLRPPWIVPRSPGWIGR